MALQFVKNAEFADDRAQWHAGAERGFYVINRVRKNSRDQYTPKFYASTNSEPVVLGTFFAMHLAERACESHNKALLNAHQNKT